MCTCMKTILIIKILFKGGGGSLSLVFIFQKRYFREKKLYHNFQRKRCSPRVFPPFETPFKFSIPRYNLHNWTMSLKRCVLFHDMPNLVEYGNVCNSNVLLNVFQIFTTTDKKCWHMKVRLSLPESRMLHECLPPIIWSPVLARAIKIL